MTYVTFCSLPSGVGEGSKGTSIDSACLLFFIS